MQNPGDAGARVNHPKVVLFQADEHHDNSDAHSELDLDLYDTDEVTDSWSNAMTLGGIPVRLEASAMQLPQGFQFARTHATIKENHEAGSVQSSQPRTYQDTASSGSGTTSNRRYPRRPLNPEPMIRTDFTTGGKSRGGDGDPQTPTGDVPYEQIYTPPGAPPFMQPIEIDHPAHQRPQRLEVSMRAQWLYGLILGGTAIGIAIQSQHPGEQVAYWFSFIGAVYIRMVTCITLPMACCQVVIGSAELANVGKMRRAWVATAAIFIISSVLSVILSIGAASLFLSQYERHDSGAFRIAHAKFAFKCHDGKLLEQQSNGLITCTGTELDKNTTFPRLIDVTQRLGLDEAVGQVDITGYVFAMANVFFPQNSVHALTRDNYLSCMLVAAVLGTAIAKSYTCPAGQIKRSANPLFRLISHIYLSLVSMVDWVQNIALWATVPIFVGAVLIIPDVSNTLSLGRYYIIAVMISGFGQCLGVVPFIFFCVTKQNPYVWIHKTLTPMGYSAVMANAFLSLPMATKTVLRTNEIKPALFNALYPVVSALNRSHFAVGCPCALLYVAAFSGCEIKMTASDVFLIFAVTMLACFGDTALPNPGMSFFLMLWRAFCVNEDTPYAMLMIATVGILIHRLSAFAGSMTNLLLIRMIAHVVDKDDNDLMRQLNEVYQHRDSASIGQSVPVMSSQSM